MPSSSAAPATEALALATAARLEHELHPVDGWARCHGDVDWDDQLRRVSLHYDSRGGWQWEYDSAGFWWAESHDGNMVLCEREAAGFEGGGKQRTHDYASARVALPGLARLVDARNTPLPPTLAAAQAEWAAAGGDPERGPALSGTNGDTRWSVSVELNLVVIYVGEMCACRRLDDTTWSVSNDEDDCTAADIIELGRLAEAADGGAR